MSFPHNIKEEWIAYDGGDLLEGDVLKTSRGAVIRYSYEFDPVSRRFALKNSMNGLFYKADPHHLIRLMVKLKRK